jgi:glycosyltransferase involved in cell wall biosynthesis
MRLLHVTPTYLPATRYGGPIQSVHGLCAALAARGHDVHVFATSVDGPGDSAVPLARCVPMDGVGVWYFPSRWLRRLYWSPPMARALRAQVGGFDLVHLHSVFLWPTWAAARAARAAGVPYLLSPRGMLVRDLVAARSRLAKTAWMTLVERANLAHASGVHVTSAIEAIEVRKFNYRLGGRIVEVPNGVALAPELPPEPGANPDYVLILGRVNWKKRIEIALEALALVDGIRLVVAGGDDDGSMAALRARAAALGIAGRVDFVGPVAGDAKRRLLRGALALLMPSLSENFGNSALEAMAEGTPAIVTPRVGIADFIDASGAGFVVAPDAAAWADAIRRLRGNPELLARMRVRARTAVADTLSWPAIGARMEAEYRALVGEFRRRV